MVSTVRLRDGQPEAQGPARIRMKVPTRCWLRTMDILMKVGHSSVSAAALACDPRPGAGRPQNAIRQESGGRGRLRWRRSCQVVHGPRGGRLDSPGRHQDRPLAASPERPASAAGRAWRAAGLVLAGSVSGGRRRNRTRLGSGRLGLAHRQRPSRPRDADHHRAACQRRGPPGAGCRHR